MILFLSGVIGSVLIPLQEEAASSPSRSIVCRCSAIAANATNTFASCAGYISGAYALRHENSIWYQNNSSSLLGYVCNWQRHWCIYYTRQKHCYQIRTLVITVRHSTFLPLVAHSING
ncbi:hypothetical protein O9929_21345 [Vibrio lentus]|nr:hypothetical protein [Vibrio lentus]